MVVRIIIAGSSKYKNEAFVHEWLDRIFIQQDWAAHDTKVSFVSGKAKGVDTFGENWARKRGYIVHEFPANWKDFSEPCVIKENYYGKYNALAGNKRNKKMAEFATHLIAFDGNTPGTNDMIQQAKDHGLEIIQIIKI